MKKPGAQKRQMGNSTPFATDEKHCSHMKMEALQSKF